MSPDYRARARVVGHPPAPSYRGAMRYLLLLAIVALAACADITVTTPDPLGRDSALVCHPQPGADSVLICQH